MGQIVEEAVSDELELLVVSSSSSDIISSKDSPLAPPPPPPLLGELLPSPPPPPPAITRYSTSPLASAGTTNVPLLLNVWIVSPPDVVIVPPVGEPADIFE